MKYFFPVLIALICHTASAQKKHYLIIGTYTYTGKSEGIYVYGFNSKNGNSKFIRSVKTVNPSFIAVAPNKRTIYVSSEVGDSTGNGGKVAAFLVGKKARLNFLNQQPSGGNHPCYVSCDKAGRWLFAANYSSGNFSLFPLEKNGRIGMAANNVQHFGSSINKERQREPHVHGAFLNAANNLLLVTDLGIDKIMAYQFDSAGNISEGLPPYVQVPAGAGPRHLSFHPSQKYVYVTEELSATVAAFSISPEGKLRLFQTISAVPEAYKGELSSADIHVSPDGRFLYASSRGSANCIAIYSIDKATGILTLLGYQPTLGNTPRNFNFDPSGNFLLVANQDSDNIVVFSIDHNTGLLTDTGKRINVPSPVCVQWIE